MTQTSSVSHNPAPDATTLASMHYCQAVTRQQAKNFYYGLRLTPEPKRSAMYAIYAWMRAADDLADADSPEDQKREQIELFQRASHDAVETGQAPSESPQIHQAMWPAVAHTFHEYQVPQSYLDDMIAGQLLDQSKKSYQTFDELYSYCYQVASTVGLVCITVWGYDGREETRLMAEQRGVALQLTNIIRDIVEDAERGRIYLPADELKEYDLDINHLITDGPDKRFDQFIRFQVDRAESYYRRSMGLERYIDPECRPTSWALMRIYHCLLSRISRDPRRILDGRVRLRKRRKLLIALNAMWKRTWQ